ncbi:adenylate/guanylate cyclase domain-containing protein [Micromonospora deserti]|uniref:Adenylyl cyclase class-3/4/guanylyl cyclase n=1 Tax=Micromonospora deserti TaxID=2070366 RepID=A0A2W2D754_9ACTN|nr:adenylate/guanylate cyclase domain-containing protein [Micromonospora deserti]PZF99578.1 adenylyl cyclase class-3/4/guanylyl cyclase [Micromonospora deserti]
MSMSTIVATPACAVSAAWPVPEERRTVTVLFADIVGSTALVDRLDPEDVRDLQRVYFDTVADVLRRWHGVVEKYIGDAVMALFGARESDGFDAYRAVRAGLEIQQALDRRPPHGAPALRVRVGVATGEALVDLAAAGDGGYGTASGAVITTAARLQEYAPPGGVALCAATHRATVGLVDQRRVPPVTVAGKALPLDVWHATAVAPPAPARHAGPLVGRRRELAAARDQIVRAVRERSPRWLSLAGPAGSGRSRLLHELNKAVGAVDQTPVRWCVAHCPPYPEQALAPVAELVRGFAGLDAEYPPAAVRGRLTTALTGLVPPAHLTEAVYALEGLLAAPDAGPEASRGAAVWQEVLLCLAGRQPVVVAVDDLDRASGELSGFLHRLFAAATARALPLAVVALHRPEWADVLAGPGQRRCRLALRPLRAVETGRLLRHLAARAGRPAAPVDRLLPLVGGNPGRAVAYVAALADGVTDPARPPAPEAVRRTVDARLDRLDGAQRAVLMVAATRDAGCTAVTVDRLLDWAPGRALPVLRALVARGLLVAGPSGGYAVVDPVVREVAYARLPRAVRATFARRAGEAPPEVGPAVRRPHPARRLVVPPAPAAGATAPPGGRPGGSAPAAGRSAATRAAVASGPAPHGSVPALPAWAPAAGAPPPPGGAGPVFADGAPGGVGAARPVPVGAVPTIGPPGSGEAGPVAARWRDGGTPADRRGRWWTDRRGRRAGGAAGLVPPQASGVRGGRPAARGGAAEVPAAA